MDVKQQQQGKKQQQEGDNKENKKSEKKKDKPKKEKSKTPEAPAELPIWNTARLDIRVGIIRECQVYALNFLLIQEDFL